MILLNLNSNTCPFDTLWGKMRRMYKACQLHVEGWWSSQGKSPSDWVLSWISSIFHGIPFLLEGTINRWSMVIQTWVSGRHFLENELGKPINSRKTTKSICYQMINLTCQEINCGKSTPTIMSTIISQYLIETSRWC